MTLQAPLFVRRFLLHSVPPGFQRIRHYGMLASSQKRALLPIARHLLDATAHPLAPTRDELAQLAIVLAVIVRPYRICPVCRVGSMDARFSSTSVFVTEAGQTDPACTDIVIRPAERKLCVHVSLNFFISRHINNLTSKSYSEVLPLLRSWVQERSSTLMEQIERTEKQRAAASARNALRHGLCARTLSLANENPEMLTTLLNDLTAEFQPHTPAERLLIVEMAQAKWHQYRIWLSETSHLNQEMAETANSIARPTLCSISQKHRKTKERT